MARLSTTRIILTSILLLMLGMAARPALAGDEVRYTKVNIHAQSKNAEIARASYANYTDPGAGHVVVPAGTKILITDKSRKSFTFTYDDGQKEVIFEYHEPRMQMSLDAYLDKITSATPVSFAGLSELDRKGIAEGKALPGMTRDGVMAALGYPATHRTPSLDAKTWIYWTNRFKTIGVEFDDKGKVKAIH